MLPDADAPAPAPGNQAPKQAIPACSADVLFTEYIYPFEVAGGDTAGRDHRGDRPDHAQTARIATHTETDGRYRSAVTRAERVRLVDMETDKT